MSVLVIIQLARKTPFTRNLVHLDAAGPQATCCPAEAIVENRFRSSADSSYMPHNAWHQRSSMHAHYPKAARFHDTRSNLYIHGRHQRHVSILVLGASEDATPVDDAYLETILGDAAGRTPKQLSVSTSSRLCHSHHI